MTIALFGSIDGTDIHEVTLATGAGAEAKIITWGAVVRDLVVPAPNGRQRVVLGFDAIDDYVAHSPYFGAIVGRYANRIGNARFSLGGRTYRLDANEKGNQLHGGRVGFGQRVWTIIARSATSVTLALVSEDGDMGYPGRLVATCIYALLEPATMRIVLEAVADQPTPVNLTTHGYFNLDGGPDICSHHLMIAGDFVTPTNEELIPTGEIEVVAGTDYDFRTLRPIGAPQLLRCHINYDINFVLRRDGPDIAHAATVMSVKSGLAMELWTTEPGLQFYGGHLIDTPAPGLDGKPYTRNGGLCLEPQRFPDGPNQPHFPPCILRPGEVSRQASELRFRAAR